MYAAIRRTRATGAKFQVVLALASFADAEGYCFPSVRKLAATARCSRSSVEQSLKWLADHGEIEIIPRGHSVRDPVKDRHRRSGGWQATNYYRIAVIRGRLAATPPKQVSLPPGYPAGTHEVSRFGDSSHLYLNKSVEQVRAPAELAPMISLLKKATEGLLQRDPLLGGTALLEELRRYAGARGWANDPLLCGDAIEEVLQTRKRLADAPARKAESA